MGTCTATVRNDLLDQLAEALADQLAAGKVYVEAQATLTSLQRLYRTQFGDTRLNETSGCVAYLQSCPEVQLQTQDTCRTGTNVCGGGNQLLLLEPSTCWEGYRGVCAPADCNVPTRCQDIVSAGRNLRSAVQEATVAFDAASRAAQKVNGRVMLLRSSVSSLQDDQPCTCSWATAGPECSDIRNFDRVLESGTQSTCWHRKA